MTDKPDRRFNLNGRGFERERRRMGAQQIFPKGHDSLSKEKVEQLALAAELSRELAWRDGFGQSIEVLGCPSVTHYC